MSMSSSSVPDCYPIPVNSLLYRDMKDLQTPGEFDGAKSGESKEGNMYVATAQDVDRLIDAARAEAAMEAEQRIRAECAFQFEIETAKIAYAIEGFHKERAEYFSRVESDVVHLALAIAAKILHRETQVDTMLIAGLVRVAIEKFHDGLKVAVHVSPQNVEKWKQRLSEQLKTKSLEILSDGSLGLADCILKTDLGLANFSIESQLKEIEHGFFDLLAQRPPIR